MTDTTENPVVEEEVVAGTTEVDVNDAETQEILAMLAEDEAAAAAEAAATEEGTTEEAAVIEGEVVTETTTVEETPVEEPVVEEEVISEEIVNDDPDEPLAPAEGEDPVAPEPIVPEEDYPSVDDPNASEPIAPEPPAPELPQVDAPALEKALFAQLDEYLVNMKPGKAVTDEQIAVAQTGLIRIVNTILKQPPVAAFPMIFRLLKVIDEHRDGAFSEMYIFRGMANVRASKAERITFERLITVFRELANERTRAIKIKHVSLEYITQYMKDVQSIENLQNALFNQ